MFSETNCHSKKPPKERAEVVDEGLCSAFRAIEENKKAIDAINMKHPSTVVWITITSLDDGGSQIIFSEEKPTKNNNVNGGFLFPENCCVAESVFVNIAEKLKIKAGDSVKLTITKEVRDE